MSADAAAAADADADAAAERRLNHSIPRTYFVRGIQLWRISATVDDRFVDLFETWSSTLCQKPQNILSNS